MACQKCLLAIDCKTDVFTVCEGSCCGQFHASCVGLSEASVSCLKKNIIWLCDDCLSVFYGNVQKSYFVQSEPDNVPSKIDSELADIKEKIAYMMEALTAICDVNKYPHQCTSLPLHSTPIHPPDLHAGTRIDESNSSTEHSTTIGSDPCSDRHNERKFSLFLTNIDGRVTEEEISDMVSRSLRVAKNEVINVKKLVPKWKSCDNLAYASFKVLLEDKLKLTALREDSWPAGVKYREFIERPRNTWKPIG